MSLYNYIETPNNNLICCICRFPFTNPTTTRSCSHTFCKDCILLALSHSPLCPVDRTALTHEDLVAASPIVRSMVDELVVECVHASEGCSYTGQRQGIPVHLKEECEYAEVKCEEGEGGCGEVMRRWEVREHFEKMHGEKEKEEEVKEMEEKEEEEEFRCAKDTTSKVSVLTEQNVLLRQRVEMLEGTVQGLRGELKSMQGEIMALRESVVGLVAGVENVGRRNEMALANETLRMGEEMMSVRAQMHGLRMQMHGMMMERNNSYLQVPGSITKL